MKLNRRGFFGAGAGAVATIAVPESLQGDTKVNPAPYGMSTADLLRIESEREAIKKQIDFQYIKKLKRIASGDLNDDEIHANTIKDRPSYRRYRPLKSISDNAKDFMQSRLDVEMERRDMMQEAQEALERYDKTGALRQIFGWYNSVEREVRGVDDV